MKRREFIALVGGAVAAMPVAASAQRSGIAVVGVLSPEWPNTGYVDGLVEGLRGLGYVEGRNIRFEYRWAEGKYDRLPELAADLIRLKVDVIVAFVTKAAEDAKNQTSTIPIVMVGVGDPVARGFVASLQQPGGNITGSSDALPDALPMRLQLLKDVLPSASRVALIHNGGVTSTADAEAAARKLGLTLQPLDVRTPSGLNSAMVAIRLTRPDALIVVPNPLTFGSRHHIASVGLLQQVPVLFGWREFKDADGLMIYGASLTGLYRRAAVFVDKILKGTTPGELPVELPRFELVLNLRTARALGITIPPDVLSAADEVIQ